MGAAVEGSGQVLLVWAGGPGGLFSPPGSRLEAGGRVRREGAPEVEVLAGKAVVVVVWFVVPAGVGLWPVNWPCYLPPGGGDLLV